MNSGDLYSLFRSDVVDTAAPYLWTDTEVYAYMNDAYLSFARLTGGIPDATSSITRIPVQTGQMLAVVSPLILRFRQAYLVSTGEELKVVNDQDIASMQSVDYGQMRKIIMDNRPGPIRYMVTGLDRNRDGGTVRWVQTPAANDSVALAVYRLPLDVIAEGDENFVFPDIGEEHIEYLMLRMKARAYGKQDAETFDRGRRDDYEKGFVAYCEAAKNEWERYKHKTRVVRYGGL